LQCLRGKFQPDYPLFINYKRNLAMDMRPKIVPETPLEYKNLMKECRVPNHLKDPILMYFGIELICITKMCQINYFN
jgi:hypothetical protein